MEEVNDKYYVGFEGEPEIHVIIKNGESTKRLVIWEAYFEEILGRVKPGKGGLTSLALHNVMLTGWMEESPWKVDAPEDAYTQLKSIDTTDMEKKTEEVYDLICGMFKEAISNKLDIYIDRD